MQKKFCISVHVSAASRINPRYGISSSTKNGIGHAYRDRCHPLPLAYVQAFAHFKVSSVFTFVVLDTFLQCSWLIYQF